MSKNQLADDAIIESIRLGSERILFKLYEAYRNEFVGWAMNNHQLSVETVRDIFQDTIISFHQNIMAGKFNSNSSLKSYLFSIGKNKIKGHFRSQGRRTLIPIDDSLISNHEPQDDDERSIMIQVAIGKLKERCRSIITLFYVRGFDMESIAHEMGFKNRDVAKKTKYECMKNLENQIRGIQKTA